MRTSIRFRLGVTICAAILLIAPFGFSLITVQAESDAEKAVRNAQESVKRAEAAAKAVEDARESVRNAATKAGPLQDDEGPRNKPHNVAEDANQAANQAANAADNAQDEAQKQRQEADAAAAAAANAKGADTKKNEEAAKQQQEADDAAAKAKKAEDDAATKEKESDEANKKAREADKKRVTDAQVNAIADARLKRKQLRAARRRARKARRDAAQAILDAEKALAQQAARVGGNQSATQKLKEELDELRKKEEALANAGDSPLHGNFIPPGNFIPQEIGSGVQVGQFNVPPGRITVTLPDDMRAGDTISGSVFAEPKGNTPEERKKNKDDLGDYVVAIQPDNVTGWVPVKDKVLDAVTTSPETSGQATVTFTAGPQVKVGVFLIPNVNSPIGPCSRSGAIRAINEGCSPISQLVFTQPTSEPIIVNSMPPPIFTIPELGQTGRPVVITGPFDGNSTNTGVTCQPVEPTEALPPSTSEGPYIVIAESPRTAIFTSPITNLTGPLQVTVNEGGKKTTMPFRNVGVNLTAPKTSLLKGESTELHVKVEGLAGITQPVPLTLQCTGVITMQGGIYQPLMIQPSEVRADGTYSTTRSITGVQAGGWGATATVVTGRFSVCMQDDSAPARRILWNTFTGDYIFINPLPPPKPPQTGSTTPPSLTGTGKIAMKGCIITLTHNAPDRRVMSRLDGCNKTGDALVQTTSPQTNFTITDRNVTDNTCSSDIR